MLRLVVLLVLLSGTAFAQGREQLPTGKQYLVGQLAAAEAKISDMLDEISNLRKQIETVRAELAEYRKNK